MTTARQPGIDALKVLASQIIVLHHLSAYGPVADAMHRAAPGLMDWLYGYGRMAVQVFLVLGGYLAVQSLMPAMAGGASALGRSLWRRYLRLAPPFVAALALAMVAAAVSRPWLSADLVPEHPSLDEWLAHALLLQEVMGVEALSAGIWYVAIDFQLHALLALLLWLGQRGGQARTAQALVLGVATASLLWWNRAPGLDDWSIYFFGAYGLGVMARWSAQWPQAWARRGWMVAIAVLGVLALLLEFRHRVALALAVALWLATAQRVAWNRPLPCWVESPLHTLGRSSYALFLVHFPVLLLGNALFAALELNGAVAGGALFLAVWGVSVLLGWAFERWVEAPLGRWVTRLNT